MIASNPRYRIVADWPDMVWEAGRCSDRNADGAAQLTAASAMAGGAWQRDYRIGGASYPYWPAEARYTISWSGMTPDPGYDPAEQPQ